MAEIQKRKAAAGSADQTAKTENGETDGDRKRKRSDSEQENIREQIVAVKSEGSSSQEDGNTGNGEDGNGNGEEDLLENALDTLQENETGERKSREDAEADRKKLLSGELLVEGADISSDDEEAFDYTGEDDRRSFVLNNSKSRLHPIDEDTKVYKDIRALPMREEEAQLLRKAGYTIVSDAETETKTIGGNMPNPFRSRADMFNNVSDENGNNDMSGPQTANILPKKPKVSIKFRTKFGIVELDATGHVIDKGDQDFSPSKTWIGRKAGFEFKLGERGLGYYRTGKKVVVPSNTSY